MSCLVSADGFLNWNSQNRLQLNQFGVLLFLRLAPGNHKADVCFVSYRYVIYIKIIIKKKTLSNLADKHVWVHVAEWEGLPSKQAASGPETSSSWRPVAESVGWWSSDRPWGRKTSTIRAYLRKSCCNSITSRKHTALSSSLSFWDVFRPPGLDVGPGGVLGGLNNLHLLTCRVPWSIRSCSGSTRQLVCCSWSSTGETCGLSSSAPGFRLLPGRDWTGPEDQRTPVGFTYVISHRKSAFLTTFYLLQIWYDSISSDLWPFSLPLKVI